MNLTEQEKVYLINELDEYFEVVEMTSDAELVSEQIVDLLNEVLSDDDLEDQEHEARAAIGHFIWENQVCYGKTVYSEEKMLNGLHYRFNEGDVVDVSEIFRILKRVEEADLETVETATREEKQQSDDLSLKMLREMDREKARESLKQFRV